MHNQDALQSAEERDVVPIQVFKLIKGRETKTETRLLWPWLLLAAGHALQERLLKPSSHFYPPDPWLPSGGVVTPPDRDLGSWDNRARSTRHKTVTKVSSLAGLFKLMGSMATWAGHGWLVSSWQQTVFGTQCIHGQRRAFVQSHADFPQVGFWLLQTGISVEKSTQAERPPLAGDFSHLITWFSFPAVRKKMELHHAPCNLGKGPIVSNRATGDRHNTCAPCFTSDIWSSKQVWVLLLRGSSIGNKGHQASPVSLPASHKKKIFI